MPKYLNLLIIKAENFELYCFFIAVYNIQIVTINDKVRIVK